MELAKIGSSHKEARLYLFTFLLAIGLRALFLVYIDTPVLFYKYPFFAQKLAAGQSIGERIVDVSPFYLYLLTVFAKLFAMDWHLLKILQAGIGAVNCLLVLRLGILVFGRDVGFAASLICAAYGNLIILETTLEPTVFVLLFTLLCVIFLYRSTVESISYRHVWLGGAFAGLAIISKPNSLLILAPAALWLLFFAPIELKYRKKILAVSMFSAVAMLVVLPVTIRNHILFHEFILVTADAGKVFYHGNGKGASALEGTALADEGFAEEGAEEPDAAHTLYRRTARRLSGKPLTPGQSSKFWVRKTLEDIGGDIQAYAVRQIKKLFYFFNDYEMHYIASAYQEYKRSLSFPLIRYGIISALGLAGMVLSLADFKRLFLVYAMIGLYLAAGLLFLVQSRYRIPAVPYLSLFAGAAVLRTREALSKRDWKRAGAAVFLIGMFFACGHFVYRTEIVRIDRWQTATKSLYQMEALPLYQHHAYPEALVKVEQCLALEENFAPAYNLRGKIHALMGDNDAARKDFMHVIRRSPNMAEGYKNAGFLYLIQGKTQQAGAYLLKAQSLSPNDLKVKEALRDLAAGSE